MADTLKVNLDKAYTFHGKDYGPGEAELPAGLVESTPLTKDFKACVDAAKASTSKHDGEPQFGGHPLSFYASKSDEEILDLKGVGKTTLAEIRAAQADK